MKLFEELNETAKFYSTLSQRNSKRIPKKDIACIVTGGTGPPRYKPGIFTTTNASEVLIKLMGNFTRVCTVVESSDFCTIVGAFNIVQ